MLNCINPTKKQAQKVYLTDGLSCTLSACGGGQGGKTGLYLVERDMDENILKNNFTKVDDGRYVTTERERERERVAML